MVLIAENVKYSYMSTAKEQLLIKLLHLLVFKAKWAFALDLINILMKI